MCAYIKKNVFTRIVLKDHVMVKQDLMMLNIVLLMVVRSKVTRMSKPNGVNILVVENYPVSVNKVLKTKNIVKYIFQITLTLVYQQKENYVSLRAVDNMPHTEIKDQRLKNIVPNTKKKIVSIYILKNVLNLD